MGAAAQVIPLHYFSSLFQSFVLSFLFYGSNKILKKKHNDTLGRDLQDHAESYSNSCNISPFVKGLKNKK